MNSRLLFERRHLFHVASKTPFAMTRAKRRIKSRKNRIVAAFTEDELLEASDGRIAAFSENVRDPSKRTGSLREQTKEEPFPKKSAACKIMKGLILIFCISCFLYQSTKFFLLYLTYPTTLSLAVTNPEVIIKPALTFCSSDIVNRTYFCTEYPNLCTKPSNLAEFCEKYLFNCGGNNSDLLIPKDEINYTIQILEAIHHIQLSYINNQNKRNPWSLRVLWNDSAITENFIYDEYNGIYSMCYSSNLHLDDKSEPEKWNINSSRRGSRNSIDYIFLKMPKNESFIYDKLPRVIFSVHSPFIPDNPHILQNELKFGQNYEIDVSMKEEHLLQHPYPTDCTDYHDLWRKNNKTGPRSQEACKKKCLHSFEQQCWKCTTLWKQMKYNETCIQDYPFCEKMFHEEIPSCEMKCKINCLKLKYYFTVKDKPDQIKSQTVSDSDLMHIFLYMDNTEVEILRHNRLYGTEELFSYIGGLMGCWLGISVWASVGIFENIYRKIVQVQQQLRKK